MQGAPPPSRQGGLNDERTFGQNERGSVVRNTLPGLPNWEPKTTCWVPVGVREATTAIEQRRGICFLQILARSPRLAEILHGPPNNMPKWLIKQVSIQTEKDRRGQKEMEGKEWVETTNVRSILIRFLLGCDHPGFLGLWCPRSQTCRPRRQLRRTTIRTNHDTLTLLCLHLLRSLNTRVYNHPYTADHCE